MILYGEYIVDRNLVHRRHPYRIFLHECGRYPILEYLASGMSDAAILAEFSELTEDDIYAVLQFAATWEKRLATSHS